MDNIHTSQLIFCRPLEIIVQYLETNYLQRFLISPMFKNYIKELIGTITVSSTAFHRKLSFNSHSSSGESSQSGLSHTWPELRRQQRLEWPGE